MSQVIDIVTGFYIGWIDITEVQLGSSISRFVMVSAIGI